MKTHPILLHKSPTGRRIAEVDLQNFEYKYRIGCLFSPLNVEKAIREIVEDWARSVGWGTIKNAKLVSWNDIESMHTNFDVVIDSKGWTG